MESDDTWVRPDDVNTFRGLRPSPRRAAVRDPARKASHQSRRSRQSRGVPGLGRRDRRAWSRPAGLAGLAADRRVPPIRCPGSPGPEALRPAPAATLACGCGQNRPGVACSTRTAAHSRNSRQPVSVIMIEMMTTELRWRTELVTPCCGRGPQVTRSRSICSGRRGCCQTDRCPLSLRDPRQRSARHTPRCD